MANRPFTDLYDYVLPYVPSVEPALVDFHIRRVTREFCRRTTLWRQVFSVNTVAAQADYQLLPYGASIAPLPTGSIGEPYSILSVEYNGQPLPPIPEDYRPRASRRSEQGTPSGYFSPSARIITLYPVPTAVAPLTVEAVMVLTLEPTTAEMPEFLVEDYREVLADGTLSSLKMLNGKPWYDMEGATIAGQRFTRAVLALRSKLRDAGQPNSSTFRGPRFGK